MSSDVQATQFWYINAFRLIALLINSLSIIHFVPTYLREKIKINMKLLIVFAFACLCYVSAIEYTLENCKCNDHYEAKKDSTGKVQCEGKLLSHIKPCNIPDAPKCVCTKDTVTGIMSDSEGTWCTQSEKGVRKLKWACENTADWDAYKIELAKYEQSLKA